MRLQESQSGYRKEVGEARTVLVSDHHNRAIFLSLKLTEYSSRSVSFFSVANNWNELVSKQGISPAERCLVLPTCWSNTKMKQTWFIKLVLHREVNLVEKAVALNWWIWRQAKLISVLSVSSPNVSFWLNLLGVALMPIWQFVKSSADFAKWQSCSKHSFFCLVFPLSFFHGAR